MSEGGKGTQNTNTLAANSIPSTAKPGNLSMTVG